MHARIRLLSFMLGARLFLLAVNLVSGANDDNNVRCLFIVFVDACDLYCAFLLLCLVISFCCACFLCMLSMLGLHVLAFHWPSTTHIYQVTLGGCHSNRDDNWSS